MLAIQKCGELLRIVLGLVRELRTSFKNSISRLIIWSKIKGMQMF